MMLNEALRLVRIYHDMSQAELADLLKISKSHLSEVESGQKNVTLTLLEKYSSALNIPMSSLLFFAEEIEGKQYNNRPRIAVADKVLRFLKLVAREDLSHDEKETDGTLSN